MTLLFFFFFKQKTAYEMRISDWSSDVCSSDLTSSMVWFHMAHFSPADNRMTSAGALTAPARQRVGCVAAVQAWRLGLAKRPSLRVVPSVPRDRPCMENYGIPDRSSRKQDRKRVG